MDRFIPAAGLSLLVSATLNLAARADVLPPRPVQCAPMPAPRIDKAETINGSDGVLLSASAPLSSAWSHAELRFQGLRAMKGGGQAAVYEFFACRAPGASPSPPISEVATTLLPPAQAALPFIVVRASANELIIGLKAKVGGR